MEVGWPEMQKNGVGGCEWVGYLNLSKMNQPQAYKG